MPMRISLISARISLLNESKFVLKVDRASSTFPFHCPMRIRPRPSRTTTAMMPKVALIKTKGLLYQSTIVRCLCSFVGNMHKGQLHPDCTLTERS